MSVLQRISNKLKEYRQEVSVEPLYNIVVGGVDNFTVCTKYIPRIGYVTTLKTIKDSYIISSSSGTDYEEEFIKSVVMNETEQDKLKIKDTLLAYEKSLDAVYEEQLKLKNDFRELLK